MASIIRLVTQDDATDIVDIYRPFVESTPISFETEPDEIEIRKRIAGILPTYPWLVCEQAGRVVGYAYASCHSARAAYRWSVDMSVYVHAEFQRRGIGRGLYVSLIRILAAQGYCSAYAGITLPNAGSVGLHESVGFEAIGVYRKVGYKLDAWHDVGWWQLALQPSVAPPRSPLTVTEIQVETSWQTLLAAGLGLIPEAR
jgi:L-amino acid N-acyltransferase YncA